MILLELELRSVGVERTMARSTNARTQRNPSGQITTPHKDRRHKCKEAIVAAAAVVATKPDLKYNDMAIDMDMKKRSGRWERGQEEER